jgi:hypothetical protein
MNGHHDEGRDEPGAGNLGDITRDRGEPSGLRRNIVAINLRIVGRHCDESKLALALGVSLIDAVGIEF